MQQDNQAQLAEGRGTRLRDFFYHLVVYVFLMALLLLVGAGGAFVWLGLFWGVAVAFHAVYAYFG
jgi:hypothetical protein